MFRERQKVKRDVQLAIMVLVSKETVILQSECSVCSSWIRADIHCYSSRRVNILGDAARSGHNAKEVRNVVVTDCLDERHASIPMPNKLEVLGQCIPPP